MRITYKSAKVERQFSSEYIKRWTYPKQVQIKLAAAENFIRNAYSFFDIISFPPFHYERLKGKRRDEWSIRLGNTGYRVVFCPCDDDGEIIVGGDIMAGCRSIRILLVTEVSNHYE